MSAKQSLIGRRCAVVEDEPVVKITVEAILGDAGAIIVHALDQSSMG